MKRDDSIQRNSPFVSLSDRLSCIVEFAGTGRVVCDVGCDHAHVPIRLLQEGRFERALGMDVLEGPLGKAAGNLQLYGMADRVELRLSDGLDAYRAGEADTLVITGMGGSLMRDILLREPEKTRSLPVLVLGPQSDPDRVRSALRDLGFVITEERLVFEDGKYYPVLRAVFDATDRETSSQTHFNWSQKRERGSCGVCDPQLLQEAEDLFGPVLLRRRDPVLFEFLSRRIRVLEKIRASVFRASCDILQSGKIRTAGDPRQIRNENLNGVTAEDCRQVRGSRAADDIPKSEETCPAKEAKETPKLVTADRLYSRHSAKLEELDHSLAVHLAAMSMFMPRQE